MSTIIFLHDSGDAIELVDIGAFRNLVELVMDDREENIEAVKVVSRISELDDQLAVGRLVRFEPGDFDRLS